jgi:hypothetical protein
MSLWPFSEMLITTLVPSGEKRGVIAMVRPSVM